MTTSGAVSCSTESLRRRIGGGTDYRHRSVSVVVCTRDRLDTLEALLDALARLDPAPAEVVVVDNAPPEGRDCRALVEAARAVYVREDRPGLNNARAAGVAASGGELIAFTDDDCVPPATWLGALDELFDDENIGAVTGPAFPLRLDTPSRLRFEQASSFDRGLHRRDFDWTVLSPAEATVTGAGANMILRRSLLERLGEVFPPELDVGTPTRSGGDMYALFKVLAAGRRVTYDPRVFTYHLHRSDPAALHAAIRGYGVGLSAVVTKLLTEEHEPEALKVWGWVARQYVAHRLGGPGGPRRPHGRAHRLGLRAGRLRRAARAAGGAAGRALTSAAVARPRAGWTAGAAVGSGGPARGLGRRDRPPTARGAASLPGGAGGAGRAALRGGARRRLAGRPASSRPRSRPGCRCTSCRPEAAAPRRPATPARRRRGATCSCSSTTTSCRAPG